MMINLLTTAHGARAALLLVFLTGTVPVSGEGAPAQPKAVEGKWTPLYTGTLDDFRIYFRGQGYIDNVHAQKVFLMEIIHNGRVVLRVDDIREADTAAKKPGTPLDSGGIGLQSEGQEVFYRNFLIRKLED